MQKLYQNTVASLSKSWLSYTCVGARRKFHVFRVLCYASEIKRQTEKSYNSGYITHFLFSTYYKNDSCGCYSDRTWTCWWRIPPARRTWSPPRRRLAVRSQAAAASRHFGSNTRWRRSWDGSGRRSTRSWVGQSTGSAGRGHPAACPGTGLASEAASRISAHSPATQTFALLR